MVATSLYSGDEIIYIWMLGDAKIGLCDPVTMKYDLCQNFFGGDQDSVRPLTCVAAIREQKLLGFYLKDAVLWFVLLNGSTEIVRKRMVEVLPKGDIFIFNF